MLHKFDLLNRPVDRATEREVCREAECSPVRDESVMSKIKGIDWKAIMFWAVLWWLVYSSPTEGFLPAMLASNASTNAAADDF